VQQGEKGKNREVGLSLKFNNK
jgi:hypothetical protein